MESGGSALYFYPSCMHVSATAAITVVAFPPFSSTQTQVEQGSYSEKRTDEVREDDDDAVPCHPELLYEGGDACDEKQQKRSTQRERFTSKDERLCGVLGTVGRSSSPSLRRQCVFFLLFASLQSVLLASAAVSTVIGAAIMVGRVGLSIAAACGVWVWFRSLTSRTVGGQLFGKVV